MKYGRYGVIKELGKGAMGVVYQAYDPQFDRLVALKVLRQDRISSEDFVKRFFKEARAIGRLSHPNIVIAHDAGQDQGTIYLAMEFVDGRPLDEIIRNRRLEIDEILKLCIQVAETLQYAHQKGVVHRDVKPGNIMVQSDGLIKIADFGIARIEDATASLQTQAGEILGTPAYMSPEQVLGKTADGRSDLFSLGVILYELTTGKRPFATENNNLATIFNEIIHNHPEEPAKKNPAIEPGLSGIIMKCLSKMPEERFESCGALAEALRSYGKKPEPLPPAAVPPLSSKKPRRVGTYLAVLAGAAIIIGTVAALFLKGNIYPVKVKTALLHMASKPQGAEIYVDDALKGTAPKDLEVAPGGHAVRLAMPGYESWEQRVQVEAAREYPLQGELKPLPSQALLRLTSTPAGADVYVDGTPWGKTPADVEIALGEHAVRMALSGYADWEDKVHLKEAREYPMLGELKALPSQALLKLDSVPAGAEVYVDETSRGTAPISLELALGSHLVRMTLPGYSDWQDQIELSESREYPLIRPQLEPLPKIAFLSVTSLPAGARIFVDGKPMGETPSGWLELPPGEYKVRLTLKGYQSAESRVKLKETQDYPLDITLLKEPEKAAVKIPEKPVAKEIAKPAAKEPARVPEKKPSQFVIKPADDGWEVKEPVVQKIK
jgi:eukaryotic-like serine/threonine-protein kinase